MTLTAASMRERRFRSAFRGFDRREVASFLIGVSREYEQVLLESGRLRREATRMEELLSEHREQARGLTVSLLAAQQVADQVKANAVREAGLILRDARIQSDLLLQKARTHAEHLQHEIDGLTLKRKDVETAIESTIQTLQNALAFGHGQDLRERARARPLESPLLDDGLASQKDNLTAPDWAGALTESAPTGDSASDAARLVSQDVAPIPTIAQLIAADIRTRRDEEARAAAAVPELGHQDATVAVSARSKAAPSWLRNGARVPDMWATTISPEQT